MPLLPIPDIAVLAGCSGLFDYDYRFAFASLITNTNTNENENGDCLRQGMQPEGLPQDQAP
jgi:hypothetical protein